MFLWEWLKNCSSSKCEYNTASWTTQALDSLIELNKVVKDTKIKYDRIKKVSFISIQMVTSTKMV